MYELMPQSHVNNNIIDYDDIIISIDLVYFALFCTYVFFFGEYSILNTDMVITLNLPARLG